MKTFPFLVNLAHPESGRKVCPVEFWDPKLLPVAPFKTAAHPKLCHWKLPNWTDVYKTGCTSEESLKQFCIGLWLKRKSVLKTNFVMLQLTRLNVKIPDTFQHDQGNYSHKFVFPLHKDLHSRGGIFSKHAPLAGPGPVRACMQTFPADHTQVQHLVSKPMPELV